MVFSEQAGIEFTKLKPRRIVGESPKFADGSDGYLPFSAVSQDQHVAGLDRVAGGPSDRGIMDPIGQVTKMLTSQKGD